MSWRELAETIRAARMAAGMTHEDVAWRAGVGKNTPGRVERAEGNPRIMTVLAVAGAVGLRPCFGVDSPALTGGSSPRISTGDDLP